MNNKILNRLIIKGRRLLAAAGIGLATLWLTTAAQAQIAILNGSPLAYVTPGGGPTVNTPFTVSAGASVLVVILQDRQNGTVIPEPTTITWNGNTLTQDTNSLANASNYRSMAMYHLFNPPPGSGNISLTYSTGNNTIFVCAYTLSGVNTNIAPIILQTNSGTATTITSFSSTATGVAAGSWAALGSIWGSSPETLTTTGTGGGATMVIDTAAGGSSANAGYVTNLSAGTVTIGVAGNTATKGCFIAEIYTPAPPSPPILANQPQSQTIFTNHTVQFTISSAGATPLSYYWFTKGTTPPLSNGGNLTGATSNVLTIASATLANAANYFVIVSNVYGTATSSVANLSFTAPSGAYQIAALADSPFAYYSFSETADPSTNGLVAQDSISGMYDGVYGSAAENGFDGIVGPQATADGLVGFPNGNTALATTSGGGNSVVTLPAFNLNNGAGTNVLTITAWIYPNGTQPSGAGIVFCRGGTTVSGLTFYNNTSGQLDYNWNNDANTYNWNSGLVPPLNVWSLVSLVITPTNATIYLCNIQNGLLSSTHVYNHVVQKFDGATLIGEDSYSTSRTFNGSIDEVGMFGQALTQSQVSALFSAGSGIAAFPPAIVANPAWASPTVFVGQTATITVNAGGTAPLSYLWQAGAVGSGIYTNLVNGGRISGATNATLTITNAQLTDDLDYVVEVSNAYGAVTSSVPATLTVTPVGPPINFTLNYNGTPIQEGIGADWNNANVWNPGGLSASTSVIGNPGSTFEVVVGSRLRNPTATINNVFPGSQLTIDGDSIFENGTVNNVGEIRFKNQAAGSSLAGGFYTTNYFPDLVLDGGQLNIGDNTTVVLQGQVTVATNSILYAGGSGSTNQTFQIDASLTGSGTIQFYNFNATNWDEVNSVLDITGATNNFTGTWDIEVGQLIGHGVNSLGTNTIIIDTNGTLETSYPISNPNASLVLNGKVYLTQADTFKSLYLNGVGLAPGTYSAATLSASYPGNFPATFAALYGTTATTASGQITVLTGGSPIIGANPAWTPATLYVGQSASITASAVGAPPFSYQWLAGAVGSGVYSALPNSGGISGATTATLTITNAQLTNYLDYVVRVSNIYGAVTSTVPATLTINDSAPFLVTDIAPNPATYYAGSTVTFTATFAGSLPISYRWVTDGGSGTFTNVPGATNSTLIITNVQAGSAGNYYLIATNLAGGPVGSSQSLLTVVPSTYEIYFGATNAITTADAVLNQPGVVTGAAVFGGTEEVVTLTNGTSLTFTADGSVAYVAPGNTGGNFAYPAPNTTGNPNFDAVLNQCTFDGGPETITLNNLVAGHKYSVLLIGLDDRGLPASGGAPARLAYYQDPVAPTDVSSTFQMGDSVYVKASFLAQTTTQTIIEQLPTSGDGNMNALVVYDVSAVVTPPSSPHITGIQVSGSALTLSATNGTPGGSWTLLQSTNLALPLNQWQTNTTGAFDGSGNLSTTIPNTATNKQDFYLLEVH